MKKSFLLLLVLVLAVGIMGCSREKTVVTYVNNDTEYVVNTVERTISDGKYTYTYIQNEASVTFFYPNGMTYSEGEWIVGTYSDEDFYYFGDHDYPSGGLLYRAWEHATDEGYRFAPKGFQIIGCLVMLSMGAVLFFLPEEAVYLRTALWVRNVEPTEFAIKATRFSGIAVAVVGLILLFLPT